MKNELIIARHTGQRKRAAAQRLQALLQEFGLTDLLHSRFRGLAGMESHTTAGDAGCSGGHAEPEPGSALNAGDVSQL